MTIAIRALGITVSLVFLALIMAYLAGFFEPKIAPEALSVRQPPPAGELVAVERVTVPIVEQATGTVQAKNEALIASRILATIAAIAVRAGDRVSTGDVLVELDSRELTARLEQQQQAVAAAAAAYTEAQANFDRIRPLAERGVASRAELDRAQAALRTAQAELARARRGADEAQAALSYSAISAPFSGRISERYADPGDTATPGTPLLKLYEPARLRLEADVRESLATTLRRGQTLNVHIDALDITLAAQVDEIAPTADPGSRSFRVKVLLPSAANLYPGMFGRLSIEHGERTQLRVPEASIARFGQLEFVRIATEQGVVRRYVRTGDALPQGYVEVVSGLAAGERVVLPSGTL